MFAATYPESVSQLKRVTGKTKSLIGVLPAMLRSILALGLDEVNW
jgi:hypothetical protein